MKPLEAFTPSADINADISQHDLLHNYHNHNV